jgi:hypothetical protein
VAHEIAIVVGGRIEAVVPALPDEDGIVRFTAMLSERASGQRRSIALFEVRGADDAVRLHPIHAELTSASLRLKR